MNTYWFLSFFFPDENSTIRLARQTTRIIHVLRSQATRLWWRFQVARSVHRLIRYKYLYHYFLLSSMNQTDFKISQWWPTSSEPARVYLILESFNFSLVMNFKKKLWATVFFLFFKISSSECLYVLLWATNVRNENVTCFKKHSFFYWLMILIGNILLVVKCLRTPISVFSVVLYSSM